ncbi:unnamed protein product [Thlaspi arvense]|uniref:Uncharacterized protein n=1 Tax=Thlaspi arvense TaxID=13288 RepID=A0AAU9S3J5_THLAR|nr:unnamed protein product [Thlaspi arvense]
MRYRERERERRERERRVWRRIKRDKSSWREKTGQGRRNRARRSSRPNDAGDPTAKAREVIRESLITGNGDGTEKENHEGAARDPDDVLAFSRTDKPST